MTAIGLSADSTYYFEVRVHDAGSLYSDSNQLNVKTSVAPLPILPIALVLVVVLAASTFFILRRREQEAYPSLLPLFLIPDNNRELLYVKRARFKNEN